MKIKGVRPIRRVSTEVQAADALRDSIVTGLIPPATRITEVTLAMQLEVSRATIRTALHQLAQEGLIVQTPYTGWAVMTLTSRDAWELYTLRASLETLAAKLLAGQISPSVTKVMEKRMEALTAACASDDPARIADADFRLHKTVVELSGHTRLAEQYRLVEQQVRLYIASSDALVPDSKMIVDQHSPIVEAVLKKDKRKAAALLEAHITQEGEILVARLRAEEAQRTP